MSTKHNLKFSVSKKLKISWIMLLFVQLNMSLKQTLALFSNSIKNLHDSRDFATNLEYTEYLGNETLCMTKIRMLKACVKEKNNSLLNSINRHFFNIYFRLYLYVFEGINYFQTITSHCEN